MNYSDKKFVAHIKDSPYYLYLHYPNNGSLQGISFNYQVPDEDLGNISIYAARNILEEDIMFAGTWGLDSSLVEILEVEISYFIKK